MATQSDTHAWTRFGDGDWCFTVKNGALYAIGRAAQDTTLASLTPAVEKIDRVEELGGGPVKFT